MSDASVPDLQEKEWPVEILVRCYRMYQKMMRYPHLIEEIRSQLASALGERGLITADGIRPLEREGFEQEGREAAESDLRDHANALLDLTVVRHLSDADVDNYINLARKRDAFQKLYQVVNTLGVTNHKIRKALRELCAIPQGQLHIPPSEAEGVRVALISHFISSQLDYVGIAKNHITLRDIDELMDSSHWNRRQPGKIGGKAAGMFLASRILLPRLEPPDADLEKYVAIPESHYFDSGTLSDFIDYNRLYSFHSQKYKSTEAIEEEYGRLAQLFENATFPPDVIQEFRRFVEEIGEHPLIMRSSSLLEDSVGFSFSGKYDSIFLANQGNPDQRLVDFMNAMKRVFMSTFSPAAILYRRDHNLLDYDERMSVLVQKVVGRRFGDIFLPFAAGVAFSSNPYIWTRRIVREEGVARLVLGLGTRAVDRVAPDYPRLVALSHPLLRPEVTTERICKYSQRMVDYLNLRTGALETAPFMDLFRTINHPDLFYALSVEDNGHLSAPLFKHQELDLSRTCVTFDNLLTRTPFIALMRKILNKLAAAYSRPVDIEFAWDGNHLFLLQCRSLALLRSPGRVTLPEAVPPERMFFTNQGDISHGIATNIEYIVYVDPRAYARLESHEQRLGVARVVSRINRALRGKRYALLGPARWGSSDLRLGVKVGYADFNHTLVLGEVAFETEGSTPEASYGTHFFNDLVEARILPVAIFPESPGTIFQETFLLDSPNLLATYVTDLSAHTSIVHLIHVPSATGNQLLHIYQDSEEQRGIGYFGPPEEPSPP
jgi:hypothetical protein